MTDPKTDMPAWASKIGEKLDKLFPESDDDPEWVKNLLTKLDTLTGDDTDASDDEPAWVKGLMERLDKLGGDSGTKTNAKGPKAPQRKTTKTAPQTDATPVKSRWFSV